MRLLSSSGIVCIGTSVLSRGDKEHLAEALDTIEGIMEELMEEGIPSENIVVLTIYTALHSKHNLGGFLPIDYSIVT